MGYRVPKQPYGRGWKLLHEKQVDGKRHWKSIPEKDFASLGFRPDMTRAEAHARAKQLNATKELRRHEDRRVRVLTRVKDEHQKNLAHLPKELVSEFEQTVLDPQGKGPMYWRTVAKVIALLGVEPSEYDIKAKLFYAAFGAEGYSLDYCQKLIQVVNLWGRFCCRKQGKFFEPLPYPRKHERKRLYLQHQKNKSGRGNKESAPLSPVLLESKASALKIEHYNWLYLTVWAGLRPEETDSLLEPGFHRIEYSGTTPILWVKQTKLHYTDEAKLWKPIPLFTKEQKKIVKIIESKTFRRPLTKTLSHHFGPAYGTYAGRKGFQDLMLSLDQTIEDISVWMGHADISRTWKSYKNKQRVSWAA